MRILIADDHPVFRAGLRVALEAEPDLEIVAETADGREAVTLAAGCRPDVVVMDLHLPGLDGVEAAAQIAVAAPDVAVLILTMFDEGESVFDAMRSGARGYLLKDAAAGDIVNAVRAVAGGTVVFGPSVARHVIAHVIGPRPSVGDVGRVVVIHPDRW